MFRSTYDDMHDKELGESDGRPLRRSKVKTGVFVPGMLRITRMNEIEYAVTAPYGYRDIGLQLRGNKLQCHGKASWKLRADLLAKVEALSIGESTEIQVHS